MSFPTVNSSIHCAQMMLEHIQGESAWAQQIRDNDPAIAALSPYDRQSILRSQLIATAWRKIGRQVLAVHPEIVEEVRVATSDKVTAEILRVLPYINPLVVFSDPPVFKSWLHGKESAYTGRQEVAMRLLGFFTCSTANVPVTDTQGNQIGIEPRIHTTTDTEGQKFTMVLIFEGLDELDRVIDREVNTLSIRYSFTGTLADIVEDQLANFNWADGPSQVLAAKGASQKLTEAMQRSSRKWMRDVLSVVVGSLFYLCSTTLEAEPVPPKYVAKRMPKRVVRTPLSFYKVGWTTGAALTRYRQSRERLNPSEQADIGHQQDPQHRKAHFKMAWYGPREAARCEKMRGLCNCGGQHRELIFVQAYWTHLERLGEEGMNTARRVPRVNGKGSARESVQTVLEMTNLPAEVQ
jgi:hypothetical protein